MGYTTAWLIGSTRDADLDVIFTGNANTQTIAGDLYLDHPTSSLSLLAAMVTAMAAGGVADPAAVLTRDRRVKLSSSGNFAVQWTDTVLRDLLGFTANLAAAASYTAPNVSPLLWSPGRPLASELSPRGTSGIRRPLSYATFSPNDGSPFVVSHGERIDQRWSAAQVAVDRVFTSDSAVGGEWATFFDRVAAPGARWYVYLDVVEETGSGTTATLAGGLGPYVYTPSGRAPSWDYRRAGGFEWTDRRADIVIPCRKVPEYT